MAVTITAVASAPGPLYSLGNTKAIVVDITFDSSYPTGGEPVDPVASLGLSHVTYMPPVILRKSDNSDAVYVAWDITNLKLLAYWVTANAGAVASVAVTNTTDLSAYSGRFMFFGE